MISLVRQLELPVEIIRNVPAPTLFPFTKFFKSFEKVEAVRRTFGDETEKILTDLKVEFLSSRFAYMAVSHRDAHVIVSTWHLKHSDFRTLYLDLIHELFHVGQFRGERAFFLNGYERLIRNPLSYFRNPIEIPAYKHTVVEAWRIGMSYDEIASYLEIPWAPPRENTKFLKTLGLKATRTSAAKLSRFPVKIGRRAPITLRPFTDYFKGFENVKGVRSLFGSNIEQVLHNLKVEFYSLPIGYASLDLGDGHISMSAPYLRDSDLSTLYLDIFLCLQYLKKFLDGRTKTFASNFTSLSALAGVEFQNKEPKVRDEMARTLGFNGYGDLISRMKANKDFGFVDLPVVIEVYKPTVAEAKRIGMSYAEIMDYLNAPELGATTPRRLKRFARNLGLRKTRA